MNLAQSKSAVKSTQPSILFSSGGIVKTSVVVFPFDLFGSAGAGAGATLLADELREILADNKRERVETRARAYTGQVKIREVAFETLPAYADWRRQGRQAIRQALRQGDFLVYLAGNHLGALPLYDELAGHDDVLVVQLDAHLDIHHFADCTTELSHGNFLLHCDGPLPPVVNVGHRDLLLPVDYVARYFRQTISAAALAVNPQPALEQLRLLADRAGRVFIDVDCDVFDPVCVPAVTQAVPFGLAPPVVLSVLEAVWSPTIQGVVVSEFDPGRDQRDQSLAMLVWLLEYLLLRRYETPGGVVPQSSPGERGPR
jgi:arginase family enzyme